MWKISELTESNKHEIAEEEKSEKISLVASEILIRLANSFPFLRRRSKAVITEAISFLPDSYKIAKNFTN